jgi:hypothetical protein
MFAQAAGATIFYQPAVSNGKVPKRQIFGGDFSQAVGSEHMQQFRIAHNPPPLTPAIEPVASNLD